MSDYKLYRVEQKKNRLVIATDIHHCHMVWHDTASDERMNRLCEALEREYKKAPYDAVLALGDYSLDHWAWNEGGSALWNPPVRHAEAFVKNYLPKMPTPWYMIPGNHEQYGPEVWEAITGRPREYAVTYGSYLFLMLDTFGGELDPNRNHDGCYTGLNVSFIRKAMEDHPEKTVVLCAHDLLVDRESEEARRLIFENPRILCAFTGHTHRDNTLLLPASWRNLPVFYSGDFSYNAGRSKERNWGYRILELSEKGVSTEYVKT